MHSRLDKLFPSFLIQFFESNFLLPRIPFIFLINEIKQIFVRSPSINSLKVC